MEMSEVAKRLHDLEQRVDRAEYALNLIAVRCWSQLGISDVQFVSEVLEGKQDLVVASHKDADAVKFTRTLLDMCKERTLDEAKP